MAPLLDNLEYCAMSEREFVESWSAAEKNLQAYALRLCRDRTQVEDLLQQTALNAWSARRRLASVKNVHAWLRVILRNCYYEFCRKRHVEEVEDPDGTIALNVAIAPSYEGEAEAEEASAALEILPKSLREPLTLVAVEGLSYVEASRICSCKLNTIRSRISRARERLVQTLDCSERARSRAPTRKRQRGEEAGEHSVNLFAGALRVAGAKG